MLNPWQTEDILVTVRAYPNPSRKHRETSCVAGIRLRDNSWIRLHPIPYRLLPNEQQFKKYDVIRAQVQRSSDARPESHRINLDAPIEKVGWIDSRNQWSERNRLLLPRRSDCVEYLQNQPVGGQSLGLVRVRCLQSLVIERQEAGWTEKQRRVLEQRRLFDREIASLEAPPYRFSYQFLCENNRCRGHRMMIVDWEVIQSFRQWRRKYGRDWEAKFRQKYEEEMATRNFHLYLGTMMKHPTSWIIVGTYYPPATPTEPRGVGVLF